MVIYVQPKYTSFYKITMFLTDEMEIIDFINKKNKNKRRNSKWKKKKI